MKILAIILARGGSKGIVKKNIKKLNGKTTTCMDFIRMLKIRF